MPSQPSVKLLKHDRLAIWSRASYDAAQCNARRVIHEHHKADKVVDESNHHNLS